MRELCLFQECENKSHAKRYRGYCTSHLEQRRRKGFMSQIKYRDRRFSDYGNCAGPGTPTDVKGWPLCLPMEGGD